MAEQLITRDYGLPETPMMQKLRAEGREEGRVEGRAEGRAEGRVEMVLRLLTQRCGPLDAATTTRVQQLDPPRLLDLADALLDFTGVSDLELWLAVTDGERRMQDV